MSTFWKSIIGACLVLLITLCATLISNKLTGNAQLGDFTEQKIYTLSDGTKSILSKLNRKVTLKFFYTLSAARKLPDDMRWLDNYYLYVKDLLSEYEKLGNGNVEIEFIDPKRWTDEEEEARKYNIRFYDRFDPPLCLGLVAETEFGKAKVLPQLAPGRQQFLEYEITKSIADLMERDKRVIGVISSAQVMGEQMNEIQRMMMMQQGRQPAEAWGMIRFLQTSFIVNPIEVGDDGKIPDEVDYLLVIHPKSLDEKTLFAIDQFAMNGGSLMVFTDPFCYADPPPRPPGMGMPPPPHTPGSDLNALLTKWGVTMTTGELVTDPELEHSFDGREKFPTYLRFRGKSAEDQEGRFNKDVSFSQVLKDFRVLGAGKLTIDGDAAGSVSAIVKTTETGNTWKPERLEAAWQMPPNMIKKEVTEGTEPVVVACLITGAIESNFPDGITVGGGKDGKKTLEARKSAESAKILVVSDVDAISDILGVRFDRQNPAYFNMPTRNHELVESALDFLGGNPDLLKVRSRADVLKTFEKYDEMDREAAKETAEKEREIEEEKKQAEEELKKIKVSSFEELKNEVTAQRKELDEKIYSLTKKQRQLLADRDKAKEALQSKLLWINVFAAPGVLVLIAIFLGIYRFLRAKHFIAHREED